MIDQILKKDKKIDWELFISRYGEYGPLFAYLVVNCSYPKKTMLKNTGIDFELKYLKRVGNEYYWSKKDYLTIRRTIKKAGDNDSNYYLKIIRLAEKHSDNLYAWCHKIKNQDFSNKTNLELLDVFEKHWNLLSKASSILIAKHNLNRVLEQSIRDKLEKEIKDEHCLEDFLILSKKPLTMKAKQELYKLSKKFFTTREIDKWLDEYNWIDNNYWTGKPLNKNNVLKKIKNAQKEKPLIKKSVNPKTNLSKDLKTEIKALQELLYLHTYELECLFASYFWCQNLFKIIAKKVGLNYYLLPFSVYPEITQALKKNEKISKSLVEQRKKNKFAIIRFLSKSHVLEGGKYTVLQKQSNRNNQKKEKVLGKIANKGNITGNARIILKATELFKLKKGEILITPMTTIDFTQHLNNAGAIVTDEGGITCHASIVSREMNIPCIIGTSIATKVFKDGDMIEVDADKGVVKKL